MIIDRPVGIDLGTTNSEIALLDPSERDIHVHEDRFGRRTVPSALAWDPKTEAFLVGRAARARRGKEPAPIESVKRSMGRATKHRCGPHELSPEEVSAKILSELHARMQEDMAKRVGAGTEVRVNRAVITVPAYFDAPQVEATRRAGELAGLDVIGIVQEPTAAAIYHTWKQRLGDGVFLIYDLGGGTFDVSILRCLGGEYQVLAIDGDNYLGGDDLDRRLAEHLRATLETRGYALKLDPEGDPQDAARWTRLVHLAQEIKETLSTSSVVNLSRDDVLVDQAGESVSLELELGRAEYDALIGDLVDTTIERCRGALAQSAERAQVSLADVDHVVLVGGSTRVPLVLERVREALCSGSKCDTPLADEVDTCVALGAAVHAAQLGGILVQEGELALAIKSPLVTQSAKLRLVLEVERAPEAAVSLRVEDSGGAELAGVELGESGARLRLEVALGEREETPIRIVAADGAGAELGAVSLALYRGALAPRPSALSQPSVISKDISLEVVRAGRREQRVLLARGTSVPAQVEHELATGDRSGAVVLRVMQDRLPIKTLLLEIPEDTEVGTTVRISLSCDDAMRLEAKAQVAGRELWARIEASALDTPDRAAIAALLAETERAAGRLWGREATSFRREADPLVTGLREIAFSDPGRAAVLAARLRELIDHFGAEEGELSPPITRFEQVLDALRRAVWRSGGAVLNMDASTWEVRIADLDERARSAWDARDADEWRRAYNEAQALYETATTQEHATARVDDPAYVAKRVIGVRAWMGDLEARLEDFVPSANSEVRDKQVGERNKLLTEVRERVRPRLMALAEGEPSMHEMRRTVDTLASELERVEAALERLPTLGLVTDKK